MCNKYMVYFAVSVYDAAKINNSSGINLKFICINVCPSLKRFWNITHGDKTVVRKLSCFYFFTEPEKLSLPEKKGPENSNMLLKEQNPVF